MAAPKAKASKTQLKQIYTRYANQKDLGLALEELIEAVTWYRMLLRQYAVEKKLTQDSVDSWNLINKLVSRAVSTNFPEEKDNSMRMAIKKMEKVFNPEDFVPFDPFYEARKSYIEGKGKPPKIGVPRPVQDVGNIRKGTIKDLVVGMLFDDMNVDPDVVIEAVKANFPGSAFSMSHVAYYKSKIKNGKIVRPQN